MKYRNISEAKRQSDFYVRQFYGFNLLMTKVFRRTVPVFFITIASGGAAFGQGPTIGSQRSVYDFDSWTSSQIGQCLGQDILTFQVKVDGDGPVQNVIQNRINSLGRVYLTVCRGIELWNKLTVAEQALVIQRIKLANSCATDAENAFQKKMYKDGIARTNSTVNAFQVAQEILIHGAEREVALQETKNLVEKEQEAALSLLGMPGKGMIVVKAIGGEAARHLWKEIGKEVAEDVVEKIAISKIDPAEIVVEKFRRDYEGSHWGQSPKFLSSYECK